MSSRKGGSRRGTRRLFRKAPRSKGKISLTRYFMPFAIGDRAVLVAEPAVQSALYHARFHGKAGFIVAARGDCYELEIVDGGKKKIIISHPVHLKKLAAENAPKAKPAAVKAATSAPKAPAVKKAAVKKVA